MKLVRAKWAEEIEHARKKLQLSQASLAKLLGVSPMAPSRWERGINEPAGKTYVQLGKMSGPPNCWQLWSRAGLEKVDVLKALGEAPEGPIGELEMLPLLKDPANLTARVLEPEQLTTSIGIPLALCPEAKGARCFVVQDDAMGSIIRKGFIAAVDLRQNKAQRLSGEVAAIALDSTVTLRRVQASGGQMTFTADHENGFAATPGARMRILGKVVCWIGNISEP